MNTTVKMTLSPTDYMAVENYARQQNLTVDEAVSKVVLYKVVLPKQEEDLKPYSIDEMCGLWAVPGITAEEMRDDYMKEKYGI